MKTNWFYNNIKHLLLLFIATTSSTLILTEAKAILTPLIDNSQSTFDCQIIENPNINELKPANNTIPFFNAAEPENVTFSENICKVVMNEDGCLKDFKLKLHAKDNENDEIFWRIGLQPANGINALSAATGESNNVYYTPNSDWNGTDSFTVIISNTENEEIYYEVLTICVFVKSVNDPPSFFLENFNYNISLPEDNTNKQKFKWASIESSGPADESNQKAKFYIEPKEEFPDDLFDEKPSIVTNDKSGIISFKTKKNAFGKVKYKIWVQDDGQSINDGTCNNNKSDYQTFTIDITPVNDPPEYTITKNQFEVDNRNDENSEIEYNFENWLKNIIPGPNENNQIVNDYSITPDTSTLFKKFPNIVFQNNTASLNFIPSPDNYGSQVFSISIKDNSDGTNESIPYTFNIATKCKSYSLCVSDNMVSGEEIFINNNTYLASSSNSVSNAKFYSKFNADELINITAVPTEHQKFIKWEFQDWHGIKNFFKNPYSFNIVGNTHIRAIFEIKKYNLIINGTGSVYINDHYYTLPFFQEFNPNDKIIIQGGDNFKKWTGDLTGIENEKTISITDNMKIKAHFENDPKIYINELSDQIANKDEIYIDGLSDQTINEDESILIHFEITISEKNYNYEDIYVSVESDKTEILPNKNIKLSGSGKNRTIKVTPEDDGKVLLKLVVTINDDSVTEAFLLTINPVINPSFTIKTSDIYISSFGQLEKITNWIDYRSSNPHGYSILIKNSEDKKFFESLPELKNKDLYFKPISHPIGVVSCEIMPNCEDETCKALVKPFTINFLPTKAIIVSYVKPNDDLITEFNNNVIHSYNILRDIGLQEDDLFIFSNMEFNTINQQIINKYYDVSNCIENESQDTFNMIIYMVGHGDSTSLFPDVNDYKLVVSSLNPALINARKNIKNKLVVLIDACKAGTFINSGTFIYDLNLNNNNDSIPKQVIITSTSNSDAYFRNQGEDSFSYQFFANFIYSKNIGEAFLYAGRRMEQYQIALVDANENKMVNEKEDLQIIKDIYIGAADNEYSLPYVTITRDEIFVFDENNISLECQAFSSLKTISKVYAIIFKPDNYNQYINHDDSIQAVPEIIELKLKDDKYCANYTSIYQDGTYKIYYYAIDSNGLKSLEVNSYITKNSDRFECFDELTNDAIKGYNINELILRNFHKNDDKDWHKITCDEGEKYTIQISNMSDLCHPVVTIFDTNYYEKDKFEVIKDKNNNFNYEWTCNDSGIYLIQVMNKNPSIFGKNTEYEINILMPDIIDSYEDDDSFYSAKTHSLNKEYYHNFHVKSDVDYIKFTPQNKSVYTIKVNSNYSDPVIELYDPSENLIIKRDFWFKGDGEYLSWDKFEQKGDYYIKIYNYNESQYGKEIDYNIKIYSPNAEHRCLVCLKIFDSCSNQKIINAELTSSNLVNKFYSDINGEIEFKKEKDTNIDYLIKAEGYHDIKSDLKIKDCQGIGGAKEYTILMNNTSIELFTYNLDKGLNLISIQNFQDKTLQSCFPGVSEVYEYTSNHYKQIKPEDKLIPGKGYWLKLDKKTEFTIRGLKLFEYEKELIPEWHIMGSIYEKTTPKTEPENAIEVIFDENYNIVNEFEPGKSYIVKIKEKCKFILNKDN